MAEAKELPQFDVVDATLTSAREGPRLNVFEEYLKPGGSRELAIGKAVDVPTAKNGKGKVVPKYGFNVKLANVTYFPKVFAKRRVRNTKGEDVLRIFRMPDETEESAARKKAYREKRAKKASQ